MVGLLRPARGVDDARAAFWGCNVARVREHHGIVRVVSVVLERLGRKRRDPLALLELERVEALLY